MKGFFEFLMSEEVRGNLIAEAIGLAVVLVGSFALESGTVSFVVTLIGAVLMISATQQIMNKISKR